MAIYQKSRRNDGFTATHVVIAIGVIVVLALLLFGMPSGVKNFFASLRGSGTASISAFGDFQKGADNNVDIDSAAETIVKDLVSVQNLAKAETGDKKDGVCFKNPSAESDFYNIVSNITGASACDSAFSIANVIPLPAGITFVDPSSGKNVSVVFKKDGTVDSTADIIVKISSATGSRIITVTPAGKITYSVTSGSSVSTTTGRTGTNTNGVNPVTVFIPTGNRQTSSNSGAVTQPSAPLNVSVSANTNGNSELLVSWNTPSFNGNSNIIGYRIYRGVSGGGLFLYYDFNSLSTSFIDYGLSRGVVYCYAVSAKNAQSEGSQSAQQCRTVPTHNSGTSQAAPSRPAITSGSNSNNQITIVWNTPNNNGSPISGYKLYRSIGNASGALTFIGQTSANSLTDTTAQSDNTYYYRVIAMNAIGQSDYSDAYAIATSASQSNNSGTSQAAPSRPAITSGSNSNNQITIVWNTPNNNGSPISGYKLYRSIGNASGALTFIGQTGANSLTDTTAQSDNTYYYRVIAMNAIGQSDYSDAYAIATSASQSNNSGTSQASPSRPVITSGSNSNNQITVIWNTPNNNGSPISGYKLYRSIGNASGALTFIGQTSANSLTDTTAQSDNTYYYRVIAMNAIGQSDYSDAYAIATSASQSNNSGTSQAAPSRPAITSGSNSNNQITIVWNTPNNNGSPISGYKLYRSIGNASGALTFIGQTGANSLTDTTAQSDNTYYYRVIAMNAIGQSDYSDAYAIATSASQSNNSGTSQASPSRPVITSGSNSNNQITIVWNTPNNNGSPISGYKLYRSIGNASGALTFIGQTGANSLTDTTAQSDNTYYYRVIAMNAIGQSDYSDAYAIATSASQSNTSGASQASPSRPVITSGSNSNNQITVIWNTPNNNGSPISGYKLYRSIGNASGALTFIGQTSANSLTDTTAQSDNTYYYRVIAMNAIGQSDYSDAYAIATSASQSNTSGATVAPNKPVINNGFAAYNPNRAALYWNAPSNAGSTTLTYKIYRSTGSANNPLTFVHELQGTYYADTNVQSGTTYYYRVMAFNSGWQSDYSDPSTISF